MYFINKTTQQWTLNSCILVALELNQSVLHVTLLAPIIHQTTILVWSLQQEMYLARMHEPYYCTNYFMTYFDLPVSPVFEYVLCALELTTDRRDQRQ